MIEHEVKILIQDHQADGGTVHIAVDGQMNLVDIFTIAYAMMNAAVALGQTEIAEPRDILLGIIQKHLPEFEPVQIGIGEKVN